MMKVFVCDGTRTRVSWVASCYVNHWATGCCRRPNSKLVNKESWGESL